MARSTYDDFNIKEKIGSGSYGVVFKVVRKVDRMTYAMKEIDLQGMSRKEQEECIRETRVLSSLDSDYIIKYYDSFLERGKLYIITEYASNGNLHDYIKKHREVTKQRLPEDLIWKLFIQILMGLNHMHTRKILHRDIKTLNVFLDDDLNVKLGDMGVAKILSTQTNFAKTIVGTPYYLSPELCEDKPYNEKSDVWALGVVLYECCVQRHPFDADNQGALILKILRGKYPPVQGYSPEVSDIIKRCLTQNANRRPNTYKLLLLPCVREQGGNAGIALPDQPSLVVLAEKQSAAKMTRGPIAAKPVVAAVRPVSAVRPASAVAPGGAEAGQHTKDLPPLPGQGLIRVVGDMQQPPNAPASSSAQDTPAAPTSQNPDKAFVFGGTAGKGKQQLDAKPKEPSQGAGNQGSAGGGAAPMDLGSTMPSRQEAAWKATPGAQAQGGPEEGGRPPAWGNAGAAQGAANRVPPLNGLSLHDEEEEEEERHNPYDNPREYRDPNDPDDQEEESG
eukprot:CAMPEP_0119104632 /NCGR_PEP_ID=MMETSP1180-20130426/2800_1 /TAXON_ID=3052 ORGANISM="Chlamydomonas cf sp, Strain CCMP681" /NCGR_SAMPLE_ID=MMETSP1180 /ASSEMBLY_ACC=CAM_ASM_000741 /LENGTH=504 /DNA_ID=CAMNT_0007089451 /DNA_START=36 /DNA_END=1546 /DNA_ORIENTATION=+